MLPGRLIFILRGLNSPGAVCGMGGCAVTAQPAEPFSVLCADAGDREIDLDLLPLLKRGRINDFG